MNSTNRRLLENEIEAELEKLSEMDLGSEPYKIAVDGLTKLIDRAIDLDKLDFDEREKEATRTHERVLTSAKLESEEHLRMEDSRIKREQLKNEKKDRLIYNGIAAANILIPAIITVWGTVVSLNFERDGSVTTIMGRGFINKMLPRK